MQSHRDEFTQFIWKRRVQTKKDVRALFQSGPGMIGKFGDMISDSTLDTIQNFEKWNAGRVCRDAISFGYCEQDDIPGFFKTAMLFAKPRQDLKFHSSRLEFYVTNSDEEYHCVYATVGPWAIKLYSKPLVRSLVEETLSSLRSSDMVGKENDYSYVAILARLLDMIHPTHQLQAAVLAFPLFGAQILKRRVVALGYEMGNMNDELSPVDYKYCLELVRLLQKKLEQEMRAYFEFTTPIKSDWIVGFTSANKVSITTTTGFPGNDGCSLGFSSNGNVIADGQEMPYLDWTDRPADSNHTRCLGVLVDLYHGSLHLVTEGIVHPPGFGKGATMWSTAEQERQKLLITKQHIIPTFSLKSGAMDTPLSKARIQVNFGSRNFHFFVNASPLASIHAFATTKGFDIGSIIDNNSSSKDRISQEEDEKMNTSLEKNYFRVSLLPEVAKSFSQFPPSVYRRSLAATRIQRAWRRYQGKQMRAKIKKQQYHAACIIQRMARRKLRKIRELKNEAAFKIQKVWRRKCHIWVALLRCIYRQPISTLHNAAMTIQRKWRNWHMFKNSPLAAKYHKRIEDLEKAVNTIIHWWRPLYTQLRDIRAKRIKTVAVVRLQALFRGYKLRSKLRSDIRTKLVTLGQTFLKCKKSVQALTAAYTIQKAWRNYVKKRIRAQKVKTRHMAATKIQAVWKGYWVRSLTAIRFSYGEVVFLMAVRKSLQNCHFILKMYKPCGIVCPKPDKRR